MLSLQLLDGFEFSVADPKEVVAADHSRNLVGVWSAGKKSAASRPLAAGFERLLTPDIKKLHFYADRFVPQLGVYSISEGGYTAPGYVSIGDRVITSANLVPPHIARRIDDASFTDLPDFSLDEVDCRHMTAVAIMTPGAYVYGHLLLDVMPRILMLRRLFGEAERELVYLFHDLPAFVRQILIGELGVAEHQVMNLKIDRRVHRFGRLLCPTLVHSTYCLHPDAVDLFPAIVSGTPHRRDRKVFLSRKQVVEKRHQFRAMANAADVEKFFASSGFELVYPENLRFREQVDLFSQCGVIAGEYGSALHNSLFSGPDTTVLSLHCFNDVQSKLCSAREQSVGYIPAVDTKFIAHDRYTFNISVDMLRMAIADLDR